MLKEDQVKHLLVECEHLVGQSLSQIRGNLTQAQNRSAAIFELIAIQSFAGLGRVEYEPHDNSPDIRVTLPNGTQAWVEVAFLYDKYWKEKRQEEALIKAVSDKVKGNGLSPEKVALRFTGRPIPAGYARRLPETQKLNSFVKENFLAEILDRIDAQPAQPFTVAHPFFDFDLSYIPTAVNPSGGGVVQEAPKDVRQHQLFKVITSKARQHTVGGLRIVCVGSDTSNALSRSSAPGVITAGQAISAAFHKTGSVGCVITVDIKFSQTARSMSKLAYTWIYTNPKAKTPFAKDVLERLENLDFNKWKYSYTLNKYDTPGPGLPRQIIGSLRVTTGDNEMSLEIPSALLIEILAGRKTLLEVDDPRLQHFLSGDYRIDNCSFIPADAPQAEGAKVKLNFKLDCDALFERLSKHTGKSGGKPARSE